MAQPTPFQKVTPAAGRLGRLGVAIDRRHPGRAAGAKFRLRPMRRANAGLEQRSVGSIRACASKASRLARSATAAADGRADDRVGRILPCLCSFVRWRVLSGLLCRRPRSCLRSSARRCVRRPRRSSIPCRSEARSRSPFRCPACRMAACRTPASLSKPSIRLAPAGARTRAGPRRLPEVEARLQRHPGDILVTPEISEKMSRPAAAAPVGVAKAHASDADVLALVGKPELEPVVLDANGVDTSLHAATAAVSRETSGIGVEETDGAHYGLKQGQIVEQRGSDGSIRRVRIVAPTLQ